MGSIAKKGFQNYLLQLQHHPLRTKAITAGALSAISDIVAQKLSGIQKLQRRRLLLKVVFGFAYLGPFGHFLHILLDKLFKGKKDTKTVAKKVVLEQLTSSPWNNLLFMIYYGLVIEARPWIHVKSKIKKEYPTVQYTAWTFWPVVGWVNHQYVPLQFRGNISESTGKVYYAIDQKLRYPKEFISSLVPKMSLLTLRDYSVYLKPKLNTKTRAGMLATAFRKLMYNGVKD